MLSYPERKPININDNNEIKYGYIYYMNPKYRTQYL